MGSKESHLRSRDQTELEIPWVNPLILVGIELQAVVIRRW